MRTIPVLATALLLGVATTARAEEAVKPKGPNLAVEASNGFACDLFRKLSESAPGKNILFSPYSIESALAMALEGARTETALEMGEVLRLPKSLRDGTAAQPWRTGPFGEGLKSVADRLLATPLPQHVEAERKRVADWRAELASINARIAKMQNEGKFDGIGPLEQQANKMVGQINAVDRQLDQFDLRVANALWGDKRHPFDDRYLTSVDRIFGAGHLRLADFRNNYPAERTVINQWVEKQTNDRIKDLLPTLTPDEARLLRLVLVNAIYFKGQWSQPFREGDTKTGDFLLADGTKAATNLMRQTLDEGRYAAFNGDGTYFTTPRTIPAAGPIDPGEAGFAIAELPIKGGKIAMTYIAPRKADGLPAIEAKLNDGSLVSWLTRLERRSMHVVLPRYKIETEYQLGSVLEKMGMKRAFTDAADFSAMTASTDPNDRLKISQVIHKAFVEVNEKGAEAAAATAVMMVKTVAMPASQPYVPTFRADRPFLFLIRDTDSGMILFLGRVARPG